MNFNSRACQILFPRTSENVPVELEEKKPGVVQEQRWLWMETRWKLKYYQGWDWTRRVSLREWEGTHLSINSHSPIAAWGQSIDRQATPHCHLARCVCVLLSTVLERKVPARSATYWYFFNTVCRNKTTSHLFYRNYIYSHLHIPCWNIYRTTTTHYVAKLSCCKCQIQSAETNFLSKTLCP